MNKSLSDNSGLFDRCPKCGTVHFLGELVDNAWVCPKAICGHHMVINAEQRIKLLTEPGSFAPWDPELIAKNPLNFPGYAEKLEQIMSKTGMTSGAVTGSARIDRFEVAIGITDYSFMVGAMNTVVGEKLARCIDRAIERKLPLILVSGSGGGAMMYEGLLSLMQMPIITGSLYRHKASGLPSICLLTQATFGGVIASWASLAQVTLAEPGADIGFVGSRVSGGGLFEATPHHFRKADYQLEHGALDAVIPRKELRQTLIKILECSPYRESGSWDHATGVIEKLRDQLPDAGEVFLHDQSGGRSVQPKDAMGHVELARDLKRPHTLDYIPLVFDNFFELHGDRSLKDDGAIVGGLATIEGLPVVVVGHQKNRTMKERNLRNYGSAGPAGYRKAQRLMELASQRACPLIFMIDTPGADPFAESENNGISYALARCQETLFTLDLPIISVITGEGGSGGAVALAVADTVMMMEYATYSVIKPEEAANIIWKDRNRGSEAAERLGITAKRALELGVIDSIIPEPPEGAQSDSEIASLLLKIELVRELAELCGKSNLPEKRYQRFRKINSFLWD